MFTVDELFDIENAINNLIQDKKDYCADELETEKEIARLENIGVKVQEFLREMTPADRALAKAPRM